MSRQCFLLPAKSRSALVRIGLSNVLAVALLMGLKVNAQPGFIDPTFNAGITNPVVANVLVQPDGGIMVRYGWPSYGLVRLQRDGTLDSGFNPGLPPTASVNWIGSQPDGKIVIAGNFLEVQGLACPCLARLNADGTLDRSFAPQIMAANIPPPPTNAPPLPCSPSNSIGMILVQPDGKVLVTGMSYMAATNGSKLPALLRLNPDGTIDNSFAVVTNTPYRMALQPDGRILTELSVSSDYPGSSIVYRLNSDGTRDTGFSQANISGWANTLLWQSNSIILGGYIYRVNGLNSGWVARLNANGQLDTSFQSASYDYGNGITTSIPGADGKLLIAGTFWNTGSSNRNLARLNPNGSLDNTYASTGASSYVWTLASQPDGKTLMGGEFTTVIGANVPPLVRLTGDSDAGPGTLVFSSATAEVFEDAGSATLTVNRIWGTQGDVSVNYQTQSGSAAGGSRYVEQSGVLVFHAGETTKTITVPIIDDSLIEDIQSFRVVLNQPTGGAVVGVQGNCVVSILDDDGPASFDPTFAVKQGIFDGAVNSLAIQPDGRLVVGGWFHQVCGIPRQGVARLNPDGTLDTTFDCGTGLAYGGTAGWLNLVKLQNDGKLLIAGVFNQVNGTNENYVARLNADGSLDASFNDASGPAGGAGIVGDLRGMELLANGKIIVGGYFTTYNSHAFNGLARLNSNGAVDTTYQPAGANTVVPFGLQTDGKVVFAGMYDNTVRCINADGTTVRTNADGSTNLIFTVSANDYIRQVSSLPNGDTMVAGRFTMLNGQSRRCLARLLPEGSVDSTFVPDMSLFVNAISPPYVYRFAVQSDGKIVAAIRSYVSPAGNYLVRFNSDGSLDTDFEPLQFAIPTGDNDTISSITIQSDSEIIIAGQFQTVNGLARPYLVRLKGGDKSGSRPLFVKSLVISSGHCGLALAVAPAKPFVLQFSTNMLNWQDLATNAVLTSVFNVVDDRITSGSQCFYRAKQLVP